MSLFPLKNVLFVPDQWASRNELLNVMSSWAENKNTLSHGIWFWESGKDRFRLFYFHLKAFTWRTNIHWECGKHRVTFKNVIVYLFRWIKYVNFVSSTIVCLFSHCVLIGKHMGYSNTFVFIYLIIFNLFTS